MPRGVANTRPRTFEDLSEAELRLYNRLPEDFREDFLSTLPEVRVKSEVKPKDKAKSLQTRFDAVRRLMAAMEEYCVLVENAIDKNAAGEEVDLREIRKLPEVEGWKLTCGAGHKKRGPKKVSANGSTTEASSDEEDDEETDEEENEDVETHSDDDEGAVIGGGGRRRRKS